MSSALWVVAPVRLHPNLLPALAPPADVGCDHCGARLIRHWFPISRLSVVLALHCFRLPFDEPRALIQ